MNGHLYYFWPGEEARMLARCQFGLSEKWGCGVMITYPIKGYPWRRNIMRSYELDISEETKDLLFTEVRRLIDEVPEECLSNDQLWNDKSEKANDITRDNETNSLCYTIGISQEDGNWETYFSIRENSDALINSELFKIISKCIEPYEKL